MLRRTRRIFSAVFALFVFVIIVDGFYLLHLVPDWDELAHGPIPKSRFIARYETDYRIDGGPPLKWQPVSLSRVPEDLIDAVLIAEDGRFFKHRGFDMEAIKRAWRYNVDRGKFARGASTISQQTAKNLFLGPSRTVLRKWHELLLTVMLEQRLEKHRILEIYLNVAEFGRGVYGVEAAARHYWGTSVSRLSAHQAVELAATLPSPRRNNPASRRPFFLEHAAGIERRLKQHRALERERKI